MERQLTMFPPRRPLLERFGAEFFRQVPECPGVYLMCGAGAGVLYVGKAKNLRQRLASYRSADLDQIPHKLQRLLCSVERIVWDECADESAALERESELLQAMRPRFNTVGVRPPMPDYLGWQMLVGSLKIGLGETTANWTGRHGPDVQSRHIYGPLLRSLWWALHPTARWEQMPAPLKKTKGPVAWSFSVEADSCEETRRRLARFFRGESPELAEWCVWSAARRPLFERNWAGTDALMLWEFYEQSIEPPPDVAETLSAEDGGDPSPSSTVSVMPSDMENSDSPFPLTPALSLGERESVSARLENLERSDLPGTFAFSPKQNAFSPLPAGEGRREGEGNIRLATIPVSPTASERPS